MSVRVSVESAWTDEDMSLSCPCGHAPEAMLEGLGAAQGRGGEGDNWDRRNATGSRGDILEVAQFVVRVQTCDCSTFWKQNEE